MLQTEGVNGITTILFVRILGEAHLCPSKLLFHDFPGTWDSIKDHDSEIRYNLLKSCYSLSGKTAQARHIQLEFAKSTPFTAEQIGHLKNERISH
ncbi:hypothetical protein [Pseudoalteromonas luteoviolacea]|uniref:Uncharacterized protein n=1 Tax=Pseudoalteromonas luteoviolacea (strain 2ta16) TaxID=1353533 RepID=V4HHH2_PSEL2|nr:hypothetical protein [Pseudoalteromonas luteoviolacea]ESP90230.1 hypothetical protein PL2TA16_02045 [Pseudoalteromonas luteoviolacea 2ta16]KZN29915.1 hypothetical protein N483_06500 [Pseudoalteromonas luteoviolacea NCIMB 1944]